MKIRPTEPQHTDQCWEAFTSYCVDKAVPDKLEDWEYLWNMWLVCWMRAWNEGYEQRDTEGLSE